MVLTRGNGGQFEIQLHERPRSPVAVRRRERYLETVGRAAAVDLVADSAVHGQEPDELEILEDPFQGVGPGAYPAGDSSAVHAHSVVEGSPESGTEQEHDDVQDCRHRPRLPGAAEWRGELGMREFPDTYVLSVWSV